MVKRDSKSYPETSRGSVRRGLYGDGRRNGTTDYEEEDRIY